MEKSDLEQLDSLGAFERRGDHLDVRFERRYAHAIEKVWRALTDPARLEDWMGRARVEPHVGGRYELMLDGPHPMTGRILVWEPPQTLEVSWRNADAPDSIIRYALTRDSEGTRMIFTHTHMPYASSALMLPGWHVLFWRLGGLLDGDAKPEAKRSWREMQAVYVDRYELRGVALDISASG
jgi:uncharacterized protein YndB with AHSA1/START domain